MTPTVRRSLLRRLSQTQEAIRKAEAMRDRELNKEHPDDDLLDLLLVDIWAGEIMLHEIKESIINNKLTEL